MPGLFDTPQLGPCAVELWPFQERAVEAVRNEFKRGIRRTLLNMATGTGKTIVAAKIGRLAIEKGSRVLFLAHTTELIDQTAAKFDMLGVEPGVEQAGSFGRAMFDADVVVASVQTLKDADRLSSFKPDYFDLVIVDEGRRVLAPSYKRILAYFRKARVLILDATPLRSDEQEIGDVVESVAMRYSVLDAWEEEKRTGQQYLCDVRIRNIDIDVDLKKLKPTKDDFTEADTDARVIPMVEMICNKVREHIGTEKTVGFWPSIRVAQLFASGMRGWYESDAVWGNDPDRASKIRRYRTADLQILSNMNMLVEGWDVPETTNVILGRNTKSWSMVLQQIGRGMRAGKEYCRVLDLGRISGQFGETVPALFLQPLGLLGGDGFDREVNAILAEMMRDKPEVSLKAAVEEAKDEHERRKKRQQFAVKLSIAERQIECYEEEYSVKEACHGDGASAAKHEVVRADFKPITDGQRRFLAILGVEKTEGWSRGRAGNVISYLKRQREAGKSSYKQRGRLIRKGVDAALAREMSAATASEVLATSGAARS